MREQTGLVYGVDVSIDVDHSSGWYMTPHAHNTHEVVLIRTGSSMFQVAGDVRLVSAGDVVLIAKGAPHAFRPEPPRAIGFTGVTFHHLSPPLAAVLEESGPCAVFRLTQSDAATFTELCSRIRRELAGSLSFASMACDGLLHQIAVTLLRASLAAGNAPVITGEMEATVDRAIGWINEHAHDQEVTVEDIARAVHVSASHLRRLFRLMVGSGPKRYLTSVRLQAAKSFMLQGNCKLEEVARVCGFADARRFSAAFKGQFGMSPSEWRKSKM